MAECWHVDGVQIHRVEEMAGPLFDPKLFFPEHEPEEFEALARRLGSAHVHEHGNLMASMHSWLLRLPGCNVLVDGCIGDGKDRMPFRDWHELGTDWSANLAAAGVGPEDIDYVMCTHLHVDHVGWNTVLRDGRWVPTFPNARYLFARSEVAFFSERRAAENSAAFDAVSDKVWDDSVLPVLEAGLADLIDGEHELLPGRLRLEPTPGHTPGSTTLVLHDGADQALFTGDCIHHPVQVLRPEWNSAYCEIPEQARATRRALLERLADRPALLMPAHFAAPHAARVTTDGDGFDLDFVAPGDVRA